MLIPLYFFRPPPRVLQLGRMQIRSITNAGLTSGEIEPNLLTEVETTFGWEFRHMMGWESGGHSDQTHKCALLRVPNGGPPALCYRAVLDLLTSHWKYMLERARYLVDHSVGDPHPAVPSYRLTPKLTQHFSRATTFLTRNRRFQVALLRWWASCNREDPLDSALDCCSGLEAVFGLRDELRLRLAFSAYCTAKRNKKRVFGVVYEMYGIRNKFIHGASIPDVDRDQKESYVSTVASLLRTQATERRIVSQNTVNAMIMARFAR